MAHHIVINGFNIGGDQAAAPDFEITGSSSDITINGGIAGGPITVPTAPGIEVDAASDVTIKNVTLADSLGIAVNSGASGVDITGNVLQTTSFHGPGIVVTDAPGTDVAGNTIVLYCGAGISLAGASPSAAVENNIVSIGQSPQPLEPCTPGANTGVSVSAGSTPGTVVDYNVITPAGASALYAWGGTSYTTLAGFTAATKQGTHDIAADPGLESPQSESYPGIGTSIYYKLKGNSPAVDSANADAPGELATDQLGDPRADDPDVSNTGAGSGTGTSTTYFDRGATELMGPVTINHWDLVPSGPLMATARVSYTTAWPVNGPIGAYEYDFGDSPFPVISSASSLQHTFRTTGRQSVTINWFYGNVVSGGSTASTIVGAGYTPVAPVRVLDTRTGKGVAKAGAIPAGKILTLSLPGAGGVAPASMAAVVLNVTVTQPARAGYLTVYPGSGAVPTVSSVNFTPGQTLANLVTVPVSGGQVSFYNGSGGTVHVVADLSGVYGPGSGYQPQSPARVLDTRTGNGAAKRPLSAHLRLRLNLAGKVPAGATAVVLNVTVTQPATSGWLAAYPDSTAVPTTSSLNFTAGQTVANQVIAPLNAGIVDLYNGSPGSVQVIADLAGYFGAGAKDYFVPQGPLRLEDTRSSHSIGAFATHTVATRTLAGCDSQCPPPVAAVDNMTVTQPAKAGYLTMYPAGAARPVASSLNFLAGKTVANLVTTPLGASGAITAYNASPGTIQLITDEFGFYIAATG